MGQRTNLAPFAIVIGIAIVLQLALIGAECRQTPATVAKAYAAAYYYLDADMQDYLCSDLADDGETVDNYLNDKSVEARQRGLATSYLRHKFIHMHLETVQSSDTTAEIHLSGATRVCINPLYMLVGKLFRLGQDYPVSETIELIKENGQWRVCGHALGLT
jgi:hypothetical protein